MGYSAVKLQLNNQSRSAGLRQTRCFQGYFKNNISGTDLGGDEQMVPFRCSRSFRHPYIPSTPAR